MLKTIFDLRGKDYTRIMPAMFAYWFHRIDMERFVAYVGDREEGLRLKDIARGNGYVLKNCKLYAWACHVARREGQPLPKAKAFGVDPTDAALLKRLNLKHLDLEPGDYKSLTLREFDSKVHAVMASSEMRNYIGRFVTKKMTFLMTSYGHGRGDIEQYLREQAVVALYKQYPRFQSDLHMVNVAKAQIHNKGQSFITSSTAKSRQRLQTNDDGSFEAVHVDIEALSTVEAPPEYGSEIRERLKALEKIEHMLPERTREYLLCAAGHHHEGFSAFLKRDNEDAASEMVWDTYIKKLNTYFEVSPDKVSKVFSNLRKKIFETAL